MKGVVGVRIFVIFRVGDGIWIEVGVFFIYIGVYGVRK